MRVFQADEGEVRDLAFSPDGHAIAAAIANSAACYGVFLWNLQSGNPKPVRLPVEGKYSRGGLQFSGDGQCLSWVANGGRLVYHRESRSFTSHPFAITSIATDVVPSADGSRIVSQHRMPDHCLIGWRVGSRGGWGKEWALSTIDLSVDSLTLSGDGRLVAMLTRVTLGERWWANPRRVEVRDAATAAVRGTGEYPYNYAKPLLFSPDASQLVGLNDMTLLVWSLLDHGSLGTPKLIRNDTRKHFTAMAYHPSGNFLLATSNDTTVHVFDTRMWSRAGRFTWQLGLLKAVVVSPDGTLAAAGGDKGHIVIWDMD